jgi:hypothetical protein
MAAPVTDTVWVQVVTPPPMPPVYLPVVLRE